MAASLAVEESKVSYFIFALFYLIVSAIPALILLIRGRGWRLHFFAVTFFITWTGGGWAIMLFLALIERDGNWKNV